MVVVVPESMAPDEAALFTTPLAAQALAPAAAQTMQDLAHQEKLTQIMFKFT